MRKPMPRETKKAKTYKGKSLKPGGVGQFAKMTDALQKQGMSEERADAITAAHGRQKYGKEQFQAMAAKGRARAVRGKK